MADRDRPPGERIALQVSEPKAGKLNRTSKEVLGGDTIEDFSRLRDIEQRGRLTAFVRWIFGFSVVSTFGIYVLEGFGMHIGFHLPRELLHWLGAATIGEIITLGAMAFRYYFGGKE